ncbi:MAG: condensation domain-containing protein [Chitinophagaceae bacterium]
MRGTELMNVMNIIEKANNQGIVIAFENNSLSLIYQKNKVLEPSILQELQKNRSQIIEYFQKNKVGPENGAQIAGQDGGIVRNGQLYHPITPIQLYWVNDDIDKDYKKDDHFHGNIALLYKVSGNFDLNVFDKAMLAVIDRHEVLHSTFHKIDETYMMKIEAVNPEKYKSCFYDFTAFPTPTKDALKDITGFAGHDFQLDQGPLFIARVIRESEKNHIVAFRIHHSISDTWSNQILLRDIMIAYNSFCGGTIPVFRELAYQFKEYMSFICRHNEENRLEHKLYWQKRFPNLPQKFFLPCAKKTAKRNISEKIKGIEKFKLNTGLVGILSALSKKSSASMFIVLQALFKKYIFNQTGLNDILLGTYIFGRDHPGTEDLIGSFAKLVLLRASVSHNDSILDIVQKVKESNEDMMRINAFSLFEFSSMSLPPGEEINDYWKIDMQYADSSSFLRAQNDNANTDSQPDVQFFPLRREVSNLIPIDMEIEFFYMNVEIELTVKYDTGIYTSEGLRCFIEGFIYQIHLLG